MGRLGGAGNAAFDLRIADSFGQHGERLRRLVARLHFNRRPVDGAAVEPWRRSGLEPAQLKPEPLQRRRQAERRRLPDPAGRRLPLADMNQSAQKGPGGENDGPCPDLATVGQRQPADAACAQQKVMRLRFDHGEIRRFLDRLLHGSRVEPAVGLRPRTADRRTLATVEDAELNPPGIRHPAHQAVERIDLPDQMALAEPADCRVAGHSADGRKAVRDQGGLGAHACGCGRGLTAGVPTTYDDDIESCVHGPACDALLMERSRQVKTGEPISGRFGVSRETFRPDRRIGAGV